MTIYRGPGGSGDATNDATVTAVAAYAAQAATSATNAANSATTSGTSATNSANSASSAAASASAAATSASQAAASQSAAATSATTAASSATSAGTQATTATTQANNAANSATAAATSASTATTKAAEAETYAIRAETAETNAETAYANTLAIYGNTTDVANAVASANTAASNAATSASQAAASANDASDSATQAGISAGQAGNSAANAANSASSASVSAANATQAANTSTGIYGSLAAVQTAAASATTSANSAATSATNAATSATNAAASAASAAAIVTGVASNRPSIRPSLLLDFANTRQLDPRVTFARASTGTFYDGKTSVKAEENLLRYSQEFDNAAWSGTGFTLITPNTTTAPDGSVTADAYNEMSGTGSRYIQQVSFSYVAGTTYTQSIYAKADTATVIQILFLSTAFGINAYANFDLANGVLGAVGASAAATITNVGNGWYRCSATATATGTVGGNFGFFALCNNDASAARALSYTGTDRQLYIWGAQLEQRSTVTAYTKTTTAAITNYIPVMQTALANLPRFDVDPVTLESKGLLIEEQRTNLLTYSSDYTQSVWYKGNASIAPAATVAPDGTLTASKLTEDSSNNTHQIYASYQPPSVATYSLSFYVKAAGRTKLFFGGNWVFGQILFDLSSGTVSGTGSSKASIVSAGNGWYRITVADSPPDTTNRTYVIRLHNGTTDTYTGDGFSGIYIWGAQLEAGSFATSYIPTVASQVTRSADNASMTGTNFSSWYRADEGSLYAEASSFGSVIPRYISNISDGSSSNRIAQYFSTTTLISLVTVNGSNTSLLQSTGSGLVKYASTYKSNGFNESLNGGTVHSNTVGVVPILSQLKLGSSPLSAEYLNGYIKRLAYYPKALTNTELQGVTS